METNRPSTYTGETLSYYARAIRAYPVLSAEAEHALCLRWRDRHDISAAQSLAASHLRLVIKVAGTYRGYGLSAEDLVGEGQLGLMRAVCRFDPDRGVRFAGYAIWWVRAAMQSYILRNWSLVKTGTTRAQRKLFFKLRSARTQLQVPPNTSLTGEQVTRIADLLGVPERDVVDMSQRLAGGDLSLNTPTGVDGENEWLSVLADKGDDPEAALMKSEEAALRLSSLTSAFEELSERERYIVTQRRFNESPKTLTDLSRHYGISGERIRQIEKRALVKLQRSVRASSPAPVSAS